MNVCDLMLSLNDRNDLDGGEKFGYWWCRLDGERIHLLKGNVPYLSTSYVDEIVEFLEK